ncbi:MAG: OB-fold nucleic acid binding domain-containing protein, partial [Gemmatimonadota bacterium]
MEPGGTIDRDTFRGEPGPTHYRDVACGLIDASWSGKTLRVAGWVHRRRDQGGVKFVLLRDRTGLVQLAFEPERTPAEVIAAAARLNPEDVLSIRGEVE